MPNTETQVDQFLRGKQLYIGAGVIAFALILGLINANVNVTSALASGYRIDFWQHFVNELTGTFTAFMLVPGLLWFFSRYPLTRQNWLMRLPGYVFVSMVFGVSHTMLMWGSRLVIYSAVGFGKYDYGHIGYRILMEYNKQALVFILIYGVYRFIEMIRNQQAERLHAAVLEEQLTRARLQVLKMQLNPHFLFNTLNMISSIMYDDVAAADRMISRLSDLLRVTLDSRNWEQHALRREIEVSDIYLSIMHARFADKVDVDFDISEEAGSALVPGFILQPLLENAIQYGMESLNHLTISVRAVVEGDQLKISVMDDGPGISAVNSANGSGVGLSSISERLERLHGQSGRLDLRNRDDGKGAVVTLQMPFHQVENEVESNESA